MEQRLDRAARRAGVELAAREVGDHLLVAHLVAFKQRQDLSEAQRGEVGVRSTLISRSLPDPFTHIVETSRPTWSMAGPLRGRVAAAVVGDGAV